jgi:hypothetical protein|tara:strand:+ start:7834 stop:8130 length:297 start_codon:yes stop_codon:yes gene_type:complete
MKCAVTDREDVIDDCYIEIQFGYGSDKDMWIYKFGDDNGAVHDIVGKKVLETIQSLMPKGKSVESFGEDAIKEHFDANWWENLTKDQRAKYRRDWGLE